MTMTEQSYERWLLTEAEWLEQEAARLESQADEDEAYSCGSYLMGGTGASSHQYDMDRVERLRQEARDHRATARRYRIDARAQRRTA
ncbi:hypothetical protein [Nostocoides vanveenii]|uniref:Uncharacterized protein n=1 Tax=Nostocoides vanveenii TaxID=330835 RepID=A0ABN2KXU9_9MICO